MKKVTIIEATSRDDITGDRKRLRVAAYVRASTEEDEKKKRSAFSMGFVLFSHTNNKGTHRVPLLLVRARGLELSNNAGRLLIAVMLSSPAYRKRKRFRWMLTWLYQTTEKASFRMPFLWCGQEDLNLHGVAPIRT